MGLKNPFLCFSTLFLYFTFWKKPAFFWRIPKNSYARKWGYFVTLWIYAHMWMLVECGKLQKNVENSPKNVGNVWKSAWKMWITAPKMWETLWIKCGNVDKMWETHLYVQMCDFVANYTTVSQFFSFYFFFFSLKFFFVCRYVSRYVCEWVSAVVLFNCMLSHVARNVREERAGVPVYLSNKNFCEHLYLTV